ncbi:MAG: immunoglobulin domain-containing protein, partial [Bacteroidetes bacterium]|nr:immunoglobulin domain-containing protein [Bacteroidota bacterium]
NGKEFTLTVKVEDQGIGYLCEYQWYKDGVAIPNATDSYYLVQNASLSDAGKYYVVVTSMKGCGETKSAEATVTLKDSYLEEIGANTEMHINSILPSPATYKATMKYTLSQSTQVVIKMLDITGRNLGNIYTGYGEAGENELVLDLSSYTSGTYYVVLESNNKRVIRSLIISK